jgi:UDP-N-acetylmuramyl pentapeptide phosphotransferase/UDP-N-acetylglucosamine-1-phosphate transferase
MIKVDVVVDNHHHHHPRIKSLDLFRHRRVAIVFWGIHDLFFL